MSRTALAARPGGLASGAIIINASLRLPVEPVLRPICSACRWRSRWRPAGAMSNGRAALTGRLGRRHPHPPTDPGKRSPSPFTLPAWELLAGWPDARGHRLRDGRAFVVITGGTRASRAAVLRRHAQADGGPSSRPPRCCRCRRSGHSAGSRRCAGQRFRGRLHRCASPHGPPDRLRARPRAAIAWSSPRCGCAGSSRRSCPAWCYIAVGLVDA